MKSVPEAPEGFGYLPGALTAEAQQALLAELRRVAAAAPLFKPAMPRSGKPFSVRMTNAGSHGWVSDRLGGYRYQPTHPATGRPWPAIPPRLLALWDAVTGYPRPPQCCLLNFYDAEARMGLHRDRDEEDLTAPVFSLSLGDSARFRLGGPTRGGPTSSIKLHSGDIVVLAGAARLAYHGIERIYAGSSRLLKEGGRLNVTLRRVTYEDSSSE